MWKVILFFALVSLTIHGCGKDRSDWESKNLLEQIDVAELMFDTTIIDIGKPAFRPYLTSGWGQDRVEKDGTTSAVTVKNAIQAKFYVHNLEDKLLAIRCKTEPGSAEVQYIDVVVNSTKFSGGKIHGDYQQHFISIPASSLVPGINEIRFLIEAGRTQSTIRKPGVSFDYFGFAQKGILSDILIKNARAREIYPSKADEGDKKMVLSSPVQSAMSFYEMIPTDAFLNVKYGLPDESKEQKSKVEFLGFIETEDGAREELFRDRISNSYFFSPEKSRQISLEKYAGQIARITIGSRNVSEIPTAARVFWKELFISTPKREPQKDSSTQVSKRKPNVFIYLVDALRADFLQSYGYSEPTSPRILQFAKDAVTFENAYAQTAWTRASVATIMTGLYPSSHLTEDRKDTLPDFLPTLAKELRTAGYKNYAFVTNGNVSKAFNFHRGYDSYNQFPERGGTKEIHIQSDQLFQSVKDFLDQPIQHPFYLYVHATDPHEPYTPAPFFLNIPSDCDPDRPQMIRPFNLKKKPLTKRELKCIMSLYESEILKADYYFGQFIDLLKKKNLYNDSLILFTADHGEEFLEHGRLRHGHCLYQQEIKIPLMVRFPGGISSGQRMKSYARHIDILPTILESIGAEIPPGVQGNSLHSTLNGHTFDGPVFGEFSLDLHISKYVILHPFKLLQRWRGSVFTEELFDLLNDPMEKNDISSRNKLRFKYMKRLAQQWSASQAKRKALLKKPKEAVLDKESEEALRALGYLQ
jgi:arylsulfatase A-like enzyme